MFFSFSLIPFQFILHFFLIHISNAISSGDDKMLIAFVRNDQKMQISEYSKQKYKAHLGIMYQMKENWKCDKSANEFEEYERTECQKYRKYLDILYEYLCREYAGIPTVKPKFVFKNEIEFDGLIEIEGPIIYAVYCLAKISKFYSEESEFYEYKLNKWFNSIDWLFQPKLLNENRLNYEFKLKSKLPINEMILQLAIDTANEWQTNESAEGIIKQNFENKLEEMFKKMDENGKEEEYYVLNTIINAAEFDDSSIWIADALFFEFVKGYAAIDFAKFIKLIKGNDIFEKVKAEHLMQQYESNLCVVYLIKNNWHQCEGTCEDKTECQMYRKYLHILYEYLFRLYAEAKSPNDSIQLSPVRPIFVGAIGFALSLIEVISNFNFVATYSCDKAAYDWDIKWSPMELVNEVELNFIEKNKDALNESTVTDEIIRKEFEQKMKKICEGKK